MEKVSLISRRFLFAVLSFHVVFHMYFYIFTKNGWPTLHEKIDQEKLHTKYLDNYVILCFQQNQQSLRQSIK